MGAILMFKISINAGILADVPVRTKTVVNASSQKFVLKSNVIHPDLLQSSKFMFDTPIQMEIAQRFVLYADVPSDPACCSCPA